MSNFYCEICGTAILDSGRGFTTGCQHYPLETGYKSPYRQSGINPRARPGGIDKRSKEVRKIRKLTGFREKK